MRIGPFTAAQPKLARRELFCDRLLLNARLAFLTADERWQVALEGKNLTDKLYYTDVFDNRGSTSSVQGTPGLPRTFAVTLKYMFE